MGSVQCRSLVVIQISNNYNRKSDASVASWNVEASSKTVLGCSIADLVEEVRTRGVLSREVLSGTVLMTEGGHHLCEAIDDIAGSRSTRRGNDATVVEGAAGG